MAEEFAIHLNDAGYSLVITSSKQFRLLRLLDMLFTVFLRGTTYQIAYVEVYSGAAFLWAEMVCKLLDFLQKPYILTLHGGNLPAFAHSWSGRVKRLLTRASAVTAPSRYLQKEMCVYREDIILIPNPLDIKNYPFRLRTKSSPRLVWLRSFHKIYHPKMAPLVVADLYTSFPNITLIMIGPDKGDGSLQETQGVIERFDLHKSINIVPGIPKNKVPKYLGCADIFINTTNIDNTPVSILEAMACGLCVVSTNVGGIPYLLSDRQDALIVPPDDPEAMAAAVQKILTESGLAEYLSKHARRKAEQFDWSVILPRWEKLFKEVLNA